MKKKEIEKIQYLGLKKTSRKKGAKYVGVTAIKTIAREEHLFLEVYRNRKDSMDEPVVRIVLTKKDFGTYRPDTGEWSRSKLLDAYYGSELTWEVPEDRRVGKLEQRNVLQDEEDLERLKDFTQQRVWSEGQWWGYVAREQDYIACRERDERRRRKYERRQQALREREENTPELPEQEILELADRDYFHREHFLYYKKRGPWAEVCCSACGGVTKARWKQGVSYESQLQRWTEEPREGQRGTCPMCGEKGTWKCQGKVGLSFRKTVHAFLGNRYKEAGLVVRCVKLSKEWQLEQAPDKVGYRMCGAREELSGIEVARGYFEPGRELQVDYHKHAPYTGEDFWDDCNLYGNANITVVDGRVLPQTYEEVKGTIFQYSALKEYVAAEGKVNPVDYLQRYLQTPQIEVLVKMKLFPIVRKLVQYRDSTIGIIKDDHAERLDGFLGIRKDKVKYLIRKGGDLDVLKVLQAEERLGQNWTEDQVEKLTEMGADITKVRQALEVTTIQKVLNRIEKYAGCQFGTGCRSAAERLKHTADTYFDYLAMRQALGYNVQNTVYQQPRDLAEAHDRMVMEANAAEQDKRLREVAEKYPLIRKGYRKLRKRYSYEDETFLIRPARSAEEIVMEGRTLHHCVGGNNYLEKHNKGQSTILFLRYQKEPEVPYVTVEMDGERVIQWYGAHDGKPDKEKVQGWIDAYTTRLKCRRLGVFGLGEDEAMQQLLANA